MCLHVPTVLTEDALPFDSPGMKSIFLFIDHVVENCIRPCRSNTQMLEFVSTCRLSNLKLEAPITAARRATFIFLHIHWKHKHDSGLAICYMPIVYLSFNRLADSYHQQHGGLPGTSSSHTKVANTLQWTRITSYSCWNCSNLLP